VRRPLWAGHLSVYLRGEGTVEKRGYFFVAKAEEMLWRAAKRRALAVAAAAEHLVNVRIDETAPRV